MDLNCAGPLTQGFLELHDLQLVKSEDVEPLDIMEPWRGSPDCKLYSDF